MKPLPGDSALVGVREAWNLEVEGKLTDPFLILLTACLHPLLEGMGEGNRGPEGLPCHGLLWELAQHGKRGEAEGPVCYTSRLSLAGRMNAISCGILQSVWTPGFFLLETPEEQWRPRGSQS